MFCWFFHKTSEMIKHLAEGAVTNRGELRILLWHHKRLIFKEVFASCTFQWGCGKKKVTIVSFLRGLLPVWRQAVEARAEKNSATFTGTWGNLNELKFQIQQCRLGIQGHGTDEVGSLLKVSNTFLLTRFFFFFLTYMFSFGTFRRRTTN